MGECNHFVGGLRVALGGHAEASGRHIKYVTKATATTLKLCQLRSRERWVAKGEWDRERERKRESGKFTYRQNAKKTLKRK